MTLSIVIHRPDGTPIPPEADGGIPEMRQAVRDAVWEVADAHWALGDDAILVSTDLSPDYLISHFRRALARRGFLRTGPLLVCPVGTNASWSDLPGDAEGWLRDILP